MQNHMETSNIVYHTFLQLNAQYEDAMTLNLHKT
jgi:hypothetical protein